MIFSASIAWLLVQIVKSGMIGGGVIGFSET